MPKKIIVNSIGVPEVVEGEPRPMMPDVFIDWLEPRLNDKMFVAEFGSGNSSLWFRPRVGRYHSVEHHILWRNAANQAGHGPKFHNEKERYVHALDGVFYDIVVIDGVHREDCIRNYNRLLSNDGVIILDNSDTEAMEGQQFLREVGFREKVFTGAYAWSATGEPHSTTVFFKEGNCLQIE